MCPTISNLKLLFCFLLLQLLSKINKHKSKFNNLREINTREFLCLYLINSMELVEKAELIKRLSFSALSKMHLERCGSAIFFLYFLGDINMKSGPVHGIMKICCMYFRFLIAVFWRQF